jgi:hypothetical protein
MAYGGHRFLVKVPFLFGGGSFAGYLYDRSGGYTSTLPVYGAALGVSSTTFMILAALQVKSRSNLPRNAHPREFFSTR